MYLRRFILLALTLVALPIAVSGYFMFRYLNEHKGEQEFLQQIKQVKHSGVSSFKLVDMTNFYWDWACIHTSYETDWFGNMLWSIDFERKYFGKIRNFHARVEDEVPDMHMEGGRGTCCYDRNGTLTLQNKVILLSGCN